MNWREEHRRTHNWPPLLLLLLTAFTFAHAAAPSHNGHAQPAITFPVASLLPLSSHSSCLPPWLPSPFILPPLSPPLSVSDLSYELGQWRGREFSSLACRGQLGRQHGNGNGEKSGNGKKKSGIAQLASLISNICPSSLATGTLSAFSLFHPHSSLPSLPLSSLCPYNQIIC